MDRVDENRFGVSPYSFHDSACVLLRNGTVAAGLEEERLIRIKHTNKFPFHALRYCLRQAGIGLEQVDAIALGVRETYFDEVLRHRYEKDPSCGLASGRQFLQRLFLSEYGCLLNPNRFHFVDHHYAHACSAYYPSGFEDSLVLTLDGVGDSLSGTVYNAEKGELVRLQTFEEADSLGFFYLDVTRYFGYDLFDEYKVMGLAPYGKSDRFLPLFETFYELLPEGRFRIRRDRLEKLDQLLPKRENPHTFSESDQDVARALQQSLERIVFHVLEHFRGRTGAENLCIAGGVGLNCTLNGEILKRGMFKRVFVQPAGHDGGLSLGAALSVHRELSGESGPAPSHRSLEHVYWGGQCADDDGIRDLLEDWSGLVEYERVSDAAEAGAELIEKGNVIGWIQGRSEFGPRALGNRSILADPRPAKNKDIINSMVKKREAFRPFAPAVLESRVADFFEVPSQAPSEFPFMVFILDVKEQHRSSLGAVTHVDGSARIQTVSKVHNERFWRLIEAFGRRTGYPVLLNTSFNNNAEPIVETPMDGLVCFLTTQLPVLIIGDWVVRKKPDFKGALGGLKLSMKPYAKLHRNGENGRGRPRPPAGGLLRGLARLLGKGDSSAPAANGSLSPLEVGNTFNHWRFPIDERLFQVLIACDGFTPIEQLLEAQGNSSPGEKQKLMRKLHQLWERRLVSLQP